MRRYVLGLFLMWLLVPAVHAQSTRRIRELERQHAELRKQISDSESLLLSAKEDVKSQLGNLALLSGQIEERKKYIASIERDVKAIQAEISCLHVELEALRRELAGAKKKYEQSVTYMYRNKSVQEKLMFIFSADNLSQMYRRLRYVREYADYQRLQGVQIRRKQKQVEEKQRVLLAGRESKERLLGQAETERARLEEQEAERKKLLASMQKKQWAIQAEIKEKRRSADRLNAQIDRLVEMEIEKARKRAEAERRAQAQRKQEAPRGKGVKPGAGTAAEANKTGVEDRRLSGVFEQNKGKLPIPMTGPCLIVGHYGQYQVHGLRNVRLDNKGIDIKGKDGAQARAVFDGEVSAVFQYGGLANVLVRHGSYISVYCNLSSVLVKKGSLLKTGDIIGQVNTDKEGNTVLHFQLRREITKLNPEVWLRK